MPWVTAALAFVVVMLVMGGSATMERLVVDARGVMVEMWLSSDAGGKDPSATGIEGNDN